MRAGCESEAGSDGLLWAAGTSGVKGASHPEAVGDVDRNTLSFEV